MNAADGDLARAVAAAIAARPPGARYVLALSGGHDSSVLLHVLASLRGELPGALAAVHVDHGLQPGAAAWSEFCRRACAALDVPFTAERLACGPPPGESVEAWARRERYRVLRGHLRAGEVLLTAHHRDDQAESVLLALLRGSGPYGLRALAAYRPCPPGSLLRPLIEQPRARLADYARRHGLRWVEDQSNRDPRRDRNYLRHTVLPALRARWPDCAASLARAARWQGEAAGALERGARADLQAARTADPAVLAVPALRALPRARLAAALRAWIREHDRRTPPQARLETVIDAVLGARHDAVPEVRWDRVELRRHGERLYLLAAQTPLPAGLALPWDPAVALELPGGILRAERGLGPGLRLAAADRTVQVRVRRGGERARLPGRTHRSELRKLFQAAGVAPWQRDRVPLVFVDGELAAVAGLWVFEPWAAGPGEPAWRLSWCAARTAAHDDGG